MKLLKALLTNRFGIVLATLNACCLFTLYTMSPLFVNTRFTGKLFIALNLPAIAPVVVLADIIRWNTVLPTSSIEAILLPVLAFLVMVQWLLIAHVAKVAAQILKKLMQTSRQRHSG